MTSPLALGDLSNQTSAKCVYPVLVAAVSDGSVPAETSDSETVTTIATLTYSSTSGGTPQQTTDSAPVTIQAPTLTFVKTNSTVVVPPPSGTPLAESNDDFSLAGFMPFAQP